MALRCLAAGASRGGRCCGGVSPALALPTMAALAADTVAQSLRDRATRAAALDALDHGHEAGPVARAVSLAAAPALYELLALDAAEVCREEFDRVGLLLGRLCAEASPDDAPAVLGAAWGEGRYATFLRSEVSVLAQAWRKPAAELTRADAWSWACSQAIFSPSLIKGQTKPYAAAGFATTAEGYAVWHTETTPISK